jgi:hypothetical protein
MLTVVPYVIMIYMDLFSAAAVIISSWMEERQRGGLFCRMFRFLAICFLDAEEASSGP